jgi:hypothetical protein
MSDDAAFSVDLLRWQLHRQHMDQKLGAQHDYAVLSQQHGQLVADYNHLVNRFNALQQTARRAQQTATARIVELERQLAETDLARQRAEADAQFQRAWREMREDFARRRSGEAEE